MTKIKDASNYELQRQKNIEEKLNYLKSLGINQLKNQIKSQSSERHKGRPRLSQRIPLATVKKPEELRRSNRLRRKPAEFTELTTNFEYYTQPETRIEPFLTLQDACVNDLEVYHDTNDDMSSINDEIKVENENNLSKIANADLLGVKTSKDHSKQTEYTIFKQIYDPFKALVSQQEANTKKFSPRSKIKPEFDSIEYDLDEAKTTKSMFNDTSYATMETNPTFFNDWDIQSEQYHVAKCVPERIYSMCWYPNYITHENMHALLTVGDKNGHIGLWRIPLTVPQTDNDKGDDIDENIELQQHNNESENISRKNRTEQRKLLKIAQTKEYNMQHIILRAHSRAIVQLTFSPANPNQLFSGSYDGSVRSTDLISQTITEVYSTPYENNNLCKGFTFIDANATSILVTQQDGTVALVDLRENNTLLNNTGTHTATQTFQCSSRSMRSIQMHPHNLHLFLTSATDGVVCVWDIRKMLHKKTTITSNASLLYGKANRSSMSHHLSSNYSPKVGGIKNTKEELVEPLISIPHKGTVHSAQWDNGPPQTTAGKHILTVCSDNYIYVWNVLNTDLKSYDRPVRKYEINQDLVDVVFDNHQTWNNHANSNSQGKNNSIKKKRGRKNKLSQSKLFDSTNTKKMIDNYSDIDDNLLNYDENEPPSNEFDSPNHLQQSNSPESYELLSAISHDNNTGRWLTTFKGVWCPNSSNLFAIGSMQYPRRIEIFSAGVDGKFKNKNSAHGRLHHTFQSNLLNSITSVNVFHPKLPLLAGGNSSGRVFIFSPPMSS